MLLWKVSETVACKNAILNNPQTKFLNKRLCSGLLFHSNQTLFVSLDVAGARLSPRHLISELNSKSVKAIYLHSFAQFHRLIIDKINSGQGSGNFFVILRHCLKMRKFY